MCLLIYNASDHRNPEDIRQTWQNLLERTHEETEAKGDIQPYEAIIEKVRGLAQRLNLSETMFPVSVLIPMLKRYAFECQNGIGSETWVVDTLIDVGVPFESLYSVLEHMFLAAEQPFQGKNMRYIANDIVYVVRLWLLDRTRGFGELQVSEANAAAISMQLQNLQPTLDARRMEECRMVRMKIEAILR